MVAIDTVRQIAQSLPKVAESTSYGTLSFKVSGKFLGRILEDGTSMTIHIDPEEREAWHASDPKTFTVPEHYKNYSYMVIELNTANENDVRTLFERAWRARAPKNLVKSMKPE